jgi:hypothetical protein
MSSKNLSPYDLPPSDALRSMLMDLINFDRPRSHEEIQLVLCATNARTARRRVFTNRDISVDALLASACLPQFFRAVEIDRQNNCCRRRCGEMSDFFVIQSIHRLAGIWREAALRDVLVCVSH